LFDFHRKLLADEVRTLAYRDAIRRTVSSSDVVLDLGSGTGILAFFACEAGAGRVFAVEDGPAAGAIAFLARHLGFADRLEVLQRHSTDISLPEPATVLITETLGNAGLDESIVGAVIDARRRLLRPKATIIPQQVTLSIVPVELPDVYQRRIAWWSQPQYGFDFSPIRLFASNTLQLADIPPDSFLAEPARCMSVSLETVTDPIVSGRSSFEVTRGGSLHGFGGWFCATLVPGIDVSNAVAGATHWKQAFFPLETPLTVTRGTIIAVQIETNDGKSWRWRGRTGTTSFDQTTMLSVPPGITETTTRR
jgi:protein arginine N-methyltransferase 1